MNDKEMQLIKDFCAFAIANLSMIQVLLGNQNSEETKRLSEFFDNQQKLFIMKQEGGK